MAKKKTNRRANADATSAFSIDQITPKIDRILSMDLRTEEARQMHAEFIYKTLCEMAEDIGRVCDAAGEYPEGVISGDAWMTGANYASHGEALTNHFAENGWLKHEANATSLWVQATLAVCSHYHHMVGPAMNASADCCRRLGDIDRAVQMWSAVVQDFALLLDEYDDDPSGPNEDDRVSIESLRESCISLQTAGNNSVDSFKLSELVARAEAILSRPTSTEDD